MEDKQERRRPGSARFGSGLSSKKGGCSRIRVFMNLALSVITYKKCFSFFFFFWLERVQRVDRCSYGKLNGDEWGIVFPPVLLLIRIRLVPSARDPNPM